MHNIDIPVLNLESSERNEFCLYWEPVQRTSTHRKGMLIKNPPEISSSTYDAITEDGVNEYVSNGDYTLIVADTWENVLEPYAEIHGHTYESEALVKEAIKEMKNVDRAWH